MSNAKKAPKPNAEELQNALQALIAQGKKEGIIKAADLNALLEKMDLNAEKIEAIYDGIEAIEALKKNDIHLMIIDVMMPKLDGIRATLKIREKNNLPIIILSALLPKPIRIISRIITPDINDTIKVLAS